MRAFDSLDKEIVGLISPHAGYIPVRLQLTATRPLWALIMTQLSS